MNKKRKWKGY